MERFRGLLPEAEELEGSTDALTSTALSSTSPSTTAESTAADAEMALLCGSDAA